MGWSPNIASGLREIQMIVPEIRTVIADGDVSQRNELRVLLSAEAGVEVVGNCGSGVETIEALKVHKPDLLFLDVSLLDADNPELLTRLSLQQTPIVIFTSTHNEDALRAFEVRALDYLLKPFDEERLHAAIERTRAEMLKVHEWNLTHRLLNLLTEAREAQSEKRLVIKVSGRVVFLNMDDIDWVEAAGNYVKLKAGKESYMLREGIGHIAKRLDASQFVRIHRSTIVNVQRIRELHPCNRGEYMVLLKDGKELSCSRGYRTRLQQLIKTA